ncbi:regulatory protein SWI6, partial [Phenoliferia sp. Uapishka_3]
MMVRGIGVMRRRSDSYLNATQILKVAGVDKGKRTKILEKDIAMGIHEKVQGGYGRYQGTWIYIGDDVTRTRLIHFAAAYSPHVFRIPFERAVELASQFGVSHLLTPLFDYTPAPTPVSLAQIGAATVGAAGTTANRPSTSGGKDHEGQSAATILSKAREQGLIPDVAESSRKRARESVAVTEDVKRPKLEFPTTANAPHPAGVNGIRAPSAVNGGNWNGHGNVNGNGNGNGMEVESRVEMKLRRSSKAGPVPQDSVEQHQAQMERQRVALKGIFSIEPPASDEPGGVPDLSTVLAPEVDPDTAIDDNDHTALHWAAALARVHIVQGLVNIGADMFRGNNVGETPLIRAVLVTNNSDQDTFPGLLDVLGASLRTVDDAGRTVLHHAALVAGVKGRASSARYYMESVLEYVARHEDGQFRELVDAQDSHGDTALNIAARVGNRGLVRILIEVGADKMKPNKLGLRPGDFGVESAELGVSPAEDIIATLRTVPPIATPLKQSNEVLKSLTSMIESLSSEFNVELSAKTEVLDRTRTQLQAATRDLAAQRNQISHWRSKVAEVEEREQRVRNLERALEEEDQFDWTGRTEVDGSPAVREAGAAFTYRGPASTLSNLPAGITIEFEADPPPPTNDTDPHSLAHFMRLQSWYGRVMDLLQQRIEKLKGGNAEQELRLRKIVAQHCRVEPDRVESMLEGLLAALESDGSSLDMTRVAGFLQRVKDRSLAAAGI